MQISTVQISNYKSFFDSPKIHFGKGFNLIIGQNNAGKTAFAEALSLKFSDKPHVSLKTRPTPHTFFHSPHSRVNVSFEIEGEELKELLIRNRRRKFFLPMTDKDYQILQSEDIFDPSHDVYTLQCIFLSESAASSHWVKTNQGVEHNKVVHIQLNEADKRMVFVVDKIYEQEAAREFASFLANIFKSSIYVFKAERFIPSQSEMKPHKELLPDASNLAQVLHFLQTQNPDRFQRFIELLVRVFPDIQHITVPPISDNKVGIHVWTTDPRQGRTDLALPLSECGTGIGQVLAMLYVVMASDFPQIILIDEPQSFLHPDAVRKLFDILKQYPQHQFIITTHSPVAITATAPQRLFWIKKMGAESTIESIDVAETKRLGNVLADIGVRLSDVFGADNILWVEGRTEEICFPLIISKIAKKPLLGTVILGVVQTGDFESKYAKTVFEIYGRLSKGQGLLPPAIGFIFDQDGRSEIDRDDLKRQSNGRIRFLPRRMYENYLLNSQAIASVLSNSEGFGNSPIKADDIDDWLAHNRWNRKYFDPEILQQERSENLWIEKVHAGKILEGLFKEFSENQVAYDKIAHGELLTEWLINNEPNDLEELANFIKATLNQE